MPLQNQTFLRFTRGRPALQRLTLAGLAVLASFGLSACADDTRYSYFAIQLSIDPVTVNEEMLRSIATCTLTVEGDDDGFEGLPCALNKVPLELGTAEFSTNKERGQLRFLVVMRDINRKDVARGESPPVAIVPNTANVPIRTMIVARAVNPAPPDASAGIDSAPLPMQSPDAGSVDAAAPADAPLTDTAP